MKVHKFSYDMYWITTDISSSMRPPKNTYPLGVGYIETEKKDITVDEIYKHLIDTTFTQYFNTFNYPKLINHPCDPMNITSIKALKIIDGAYVVVNNIRKVY